MNRKESAKKLSETKEELAKKCDRLIKTTKSIPRLKTLRYQAARFRRQAADLTRQ